jgi:hypothetical protein
MAQAIWGRLFTSGGFRQRFLDLTQFSALLEENRGLGRLLAFATGGVSPPVVFMSKLFVLKGFR